jgi:hypothetical protein
MPKPWLESILLPERTRPFDRRIKPLNHMLFLDIGFRKKSQEVLDYRLGIASFRDLIKVGTPGA